MCTACAGRNGTGLCDELECRPLCLAWATQRSLLVVVRARALHARHRDSLGRFLALLRVRIECVHAVSCVAGSADAIRGACATARNAVHLTIVVLPRGLSRQAAARYASARGQLTVVVCSRCVTTRGRQCRACVDWQVPACASHFERLLCVWLQVCITYWTICVAVIDSLLFVAATLAFS